MSTMETKIVCPVCGAEFACPQHSSIATGLIVGKDSNLGTISPELANNNGSKINKANEKKLAALKAAGIEVMNFFSMHTGASTSVLVRMGDKGIEQVADDDPVVAKIMAEGTVPNRRLFRRWIMSQMFHMLAYPKAKGGLGGFDMALQNKGYRYQWRMLVDEFKIQAKLFENDPENFEERNRWFDADVVVRAADDYRDKVCQYAVTDYARSRFSHGRFRNASDFNMNVMSEINNLTWNIRGASSPTELYNRVKEFATYVTSHYVASSWDMSRAFKSAYKGAGAYYTLKNMILFHNCFLKNEAGHTLTKVGSIKKLVQLSKGYEMNGICEKGDRLFEELKGFLDYNNIDIQAKMAEWRTKTN